MAPLLFGLLFGIVDYGFYFADVVTVQQGLGDAARNAVTGPRVGVRTAVGWQHLPAPAGLERGGDQLQRLACSVLDGVDPVAGQLYVRAVARRRRRATPPRPGRRETGCASAR